MSDSDENALSSLVGSSSLSRLASLDLSSLSSIPTHHDFVLFQMVMKLARLILELQDCVTSPSDGAEKIADHSAKFDSILREFLKESERFGKSD